MSNAASSSAYQPRGRRRTREVSPLTQSYIPSSDDESFFGTDTDASSAPPSPPAQTIQHRRKASRIEDVGELSLDLLSFTPVSQPAATKPSESKQSQPLPKSPDPPTPPPKPSPKASSSLLVAPLKIKKKPLRSAKPVLSIVTSPMTTPRAVRLLVASIGNPKPYHSTRHSAGHHLLQALQSHLGLAPLTKAKTGLVSSGSDAGRPQFTLWQSTSSMNVSGKNLLQAWKMFSSSQADAEDAVTGLVVLHDELESAPGVLKLRRGDGSAKGHNGLKSIQNSFKTAGVLDQLGDKRYIRVGIGIGRPESRDKGDVSAYVLGQLTGREKRIIEARAEALVGLLEKEVQTLSTLSC